MKKRKKLMKRIGALVCALVVAVSVLGVSMPYYASELLGVFYNYTGLSSGDYSVFVEYEDTSIQWELPSSVSNYEYCVILKDSRGGAYVWCSNSPIIFQTIVGTTDSNGRTSVKVIINSDTYIYMFYHHYNEFSWKSSTVDGREWAARWSQSFNSDGSPYTGDLGSYKVVYSSHDLWVNTDFKILNGSVVSGESYNSSIGYLQNVSRKSTYVRGALYNYDEESLTRHYYHDTASTTGVDLTSGNYVIRHYVSNATVKGYEKEDIVEMTDKYLMAEYNASKGYFSYLQKDYDTKLETLGYDGLSWVDKYINGYFVLQHHYLQIVNTVTNEVGGYVHLYPKDSDSDSFGVELNHEGLDENFEVDDDAPSGVVDDSTGSGLTHDEALNNADAPKFDDLGGVDEFASVLESYATQVGEVSNGVGAFLGALPPWILACVAIGLGTTLLVVVIKVLRG